MKQVIRPHFPHPLGTHTHKKKPSQTLKVKTIFLYSLFTLKEMQMIQFPSNQFLIY